MYAISPARQHPQFTTHCEQEVGSWTLSTAFTSTRLDASAWYSSTTEKNQEYKKLHQTSRSSSNPAAHSRGPAL